MSTNVEYYKTKNDLIIAWKDYCEHKPPCCFTDIFSFVTWLYRDKETTDREKFIMTLWSNSETHVGCYEWLEKLAWKAYKERRKK